MITGNGLPSNINTNEIDLSYGDWVIVGILIGICAVLLIAFIIKCLAYSKKIDMLESLSKHEIDDKEMNLILTYRELNDKDKAIVSDTLKSLSKHHTNTD